MSQSKHAHEFLADRLLYAQLQRLNERRDAQSDPLGARLQYSCRKFCRGQYLFSGVIFTEDWQKVFCSFSILFKGRDWEMTASSADFALSMFFGLQSRTLAFFAVIDYLERTGRIPEGSLGRHKEIVERNAKRPERVSAVKEYNDFRARAAKDMPYDLSLEVLEMIGWPPMVRRGEPVAA